MHSSTCPPNDKEISNSPFIQRHLLPFYPSKKHVGTLGPIYEEKDLDETRRIYDPKKI